MKIPSVPFCICLKKNNSAFSSPCREKSVLPYCVNPSYMSPLLVTQNTHISDTSGHQMYAGFFPPYNMQFSVTSAGYPTI